MILVLPFHAGDGDRAIKNLLWMEELDRTLPFEAALSYDDKTPKAMVEAMKSAAGRVFTKVHEFWYPAPQKPYWPYAPNWAWQQIARYMACVLKKPWLFLEADAVPIRSGWLQDIWREHQSANKPFSGHIVAGMGHPNGVCVYPPDVSFFVPDALRVEETAWDVVMGHELTLREGGVSAHVHPSHRLFQHCWNVNPADGKAWNGHGEPATFKSMDDVLRLVDLSMGIFHRCKDGTLIDWLRKYHRDPSAAMVPQHTARLLDNEPKPENRNQDSPGNGSLVAVSDPGAKGSVESTKPEACPKTEIFIVTYGLPTKRVSGQIVSDFDWLAWCLRCIRRHCKGFTGITLAIPNRDASMLKPLASEHSKGGGGLPLRIRMFKEPEGKGFLMHEAVMASADEFVPSDTQFVLHVDADVMFKETVTPDSYIENGKPVYVWRTYDSLSSTVNGQTVVSDCYQWKIPTEEQLGFPVQAYTMARHPSGFPIDFYKHYRDHVASVHGKPFMDYMLSGRNEFPSNRMDFTAMGAFAFERMKDRFSWCDISAGNHLAPPDKQKTYWSHGGVTDHIKKEIEGFLK